MTSNPILHLMAVEKDINPTTTGSFSVYNLINDLDYSTYLVNATNTITTCIHRHYIIRSHEAEVSIAKDETYQKEMIQQLPSKVILSKNKQRDLKAMVSTAHDSHGNDSSLKLSCI